MPPSVGWCWTAIFTRSAAHGRWRPVGRDGRRGTACCGRARRRDHLLGRGRRRGKEEDRRPILHLPSAAGGGSPTRTRETGTARPRRQGDRVSALVLIRSRLRFEDLSHAGRREADGAEWRLRRCALQVLDHLLGRLWQGARLWQRGPRREHLVRIHPTTQQEGTAPLERRRVAGVVFGRLLPLLLGAQSEICNLLDGAGRMPVTLTTRI